MSDAFDVVTLGTDTSGRPIRMTRRMLLAFQIACEEAGVTPTITQGAFLGTAAAGASAGTHDLSGCIDTRTWDLSDAERNRLIVAARTIGWGVWFRTPPAFDEHCHWVLPGEKPMHPDAVSQVTEYLAGGDGLLGFAPDPAGFRPDPIPFFDYDKACAQEDDMNLNDKLFPDREDSPTIRESLVAASHANHKLDRVLTRLGDFRRATAERDAGLAAQLDQIAGQLADDATREQVRRVIAELRHRQARRDDEDDPDG